MRPENCNWQPAEVEALMSFVKERTGDELAPVPISDILWADLSKAWHALGEVKGFGNIPRNAKAMYSRHRDLRKKAGRTDGSALRDYWQPAEEEALLRFLKVGKGGKMAKVAWNDGAWMELEKGWQVLGTIKGFNTNRTAMSMYIKHRKLIKRRAYQALENPQPSMTSATAPPPPVSRYGRKRTQFVPFVLDTASSTSAKKARVEDLDPDVEEAGSALCALRSFAG